MKVTKTPFDGLFVIEPRIFKDQRGYFYESYNRKQFLDAGIDIDFVQDNESVSSSGVIRGLHYQRPPFAQAKLVRVVAGAIQDVVVDLRKSQATFGKCHAIELSSENGKQLLVPKGFAHGFLVLQDFTKVLYKTDSYYNADAEAGIFFADPELKIEWKLKREEIVISPKDQLLPTFDRAAGYF